MKYSAEYKTIRLSDGQTGCIRTISFFFFFLVYVHSSRILITIDASVIVIIKLRITMDKKRFNQVPSGIAIGKVSADINVMIWPVSLFK